MPEWRLDAHGLSEEATIFAERELEVVRSEVLRKKLEPLSGREWIPQDMEIDAWAEFYVHQMYELLGVAQAIGDATDDLPLANISISEERFNIRDYGCAYKHTFKEIERAEALDKRLDQRRAEAARRATNQKLNQIMWFGDPATDLFGAVNYPDVPRVAMRDTVDETTGASVILDMLNDLVNGTFQETRQTARPDTVLFATNPYTHISSTRLSSGTDTTILEYFETNNPFVETTDTVPELDGAGPNGEDLIFAFNSNGETFEHKLAREFTQRPPQDKNLAVITNCIAATGGVAYNYPLEAVVGEIPLS